MGLPNNYSKESYWNAIDASRERLGYRKNQFSKMLGATPGYFSTCLNDLTDMKISYAWKYAAAVGLTLDEAVKNDGRNRYFDFLDKQHLDYEKLPNDCLLKFIRYKSLIPTLFDAVDLCRDRNLMDVIKSCLIMSSEKLFMFF